MADGPGSRLKQTIAVALAYRPHSADDAPKVVATGRGAVAEEILRRAFDTGVRVRTDPDLAQILSVVDVDTLIPVEAFMAVAEILVRVYQANGQTVPQPASSAGEMPPHPPGSVAGSAATGWQQALKEKGR